MTAWQLVVHDGDYSKFSVKEARLWRPGGLGRRTLPGRAGKHNSEAIMTLTPSRLRVRVMKNDFDFDLVGSQWVQA